MLKKRKNIYTWTSFHLRNCRLYVAEFSDQRPNIGRPRPRPLPRPLPFDPRPPGPRPLMGVLPPEQLYWVTDLEEHLTVAEQAMVASSVQVQLRVSPSGHRTIAEAKLNIRVKARIKARRIVQAEPEMNSRRWAYYGQKINLLSLKFTFSRLINEMNFIPSSFVSSCI